MSVEAISWALNLAPVPADRGGQPSSACKFVLVGLANHAGPDGTGAFPSVATLVRYTGLSERTVRTCLDRPEAAGIVWPCDPGIVAARIKRADRRPQGWDLNLSLVRDDLDDAAIAVLEHQFPGLGIRLATAAPPAGERATGGPAGQQRTAALRLLRAWVEDVLRGRHPGLARDNLQPCWDGHDDVVDQLTALQAAWPGVYRGTAASATAAIKWHDRWLPGCLARFKAAFKARPCDRAGHQPPPGIKAPGDPAAASEPAEPGPGR